jgi:carboxypeptidase T
MKTPKLLFFFVTFLAYSNNAVSQTVDYHTKVKVYVAPNSPERLQAIGLLGLDHFSDMPGYIEAEIGQREMKLLKQSTLRYEVLIENTIAEVASQNRTFFEQRKFGLINDDGSPISSTIMSRSPFEQPGDIIDNIINTPTGFRVYNENFGYYSVARMDSIIAAVFNIYSASNLVDTFHIGTASATGSTNIIKVVKISDNASNDEAGEPDCFFQGLQHAREAIGGSSMIFTMLYLLENYNTDLRIKNLVDNREIYIIICMNPDGWAYNLANITATTGGTWRKNRNDNGDGTLGVDLNRNWSSDWANCGGDLQCGSATTSSDVYWGTAPFSENETQAVRNFIKSKRIVVANDQHSYGPYFSLPFGRPSLHTDDPANPSTPNTEDDTLSTEEQNWYRSITALMGKYNGMRAGNSFQALGYQVAGGVKDWMARGEIGTGINTGQKNAIRSMTGEGGVRVTGPGQSISPSVKNFWPAASQIINLCKGMLYQNLQMIYSAGSFVDLQDMTSIGLASKSGNFTFRIKRLGLDDEPVTISVIPVMNTGTVGSPVVVSTLPNYYDTYTGNISYNLPAAITPGQIVKFAWKVETTGYSYVDTITKFFSPTILLSDNMEGSFATNWLNETEGNSISSGFASPYNYTYTQGDWQFTTGGWGGSGNALSESANGINYPATSIRRVRYNSTFNLTGATAAYLSFFTKHDLDNHKDKVQVQVSTDGSTWIPIDGKTTVKEPGLPSATDGSKLNGLPALTGIQPDWVQEEFNLVSVLGEPTVYLRFEFTSDQADPVFFAGQQDGIYIDNVTVIATSTPLFTLAADILSLSGKLNTDKTIQLNWEAITDDEHSYFEVQKSLNGNTFRDIGRVTSNDNPYTFIDPLPFVGNNFYRIKSVDNNGKVAYSYILNIVYSPSLRWISLYPNPAKDILQVELKLAAKDKTLLQFVDLAGKKVLENIIVTDDNIKNFPINISTLTPNIYILKIINSKNEIVGIQKFIKM